MSLEQKLLAVLHHTDWKEKTEMVDEMQKKFGQRHDVGRVAGKLRTMEGKGLVEHKEEDFDKLRVISRSGRPYLLYRLTSDGVRRRFVLEQTIKDSVSGEAEAETI